MMMIIVMIMIMIGIYDNSVKWTSRSEKDSCRESMKLPRHYYIIAVVRTR